MAQDRPKMRSKGATGNIEQTQPGGSGPPRGLKILNRRLGESEAECAQDLTRRWTVGPANYNLGLRCKSLPRLDM